LGVPRVEVAVLGSLAEEPCYGYDLLDRMRERSMRFWAEVGKASVYQTLGRLEVRGLVSGRAQEGSEGPDRRVYRITKAGQRRLREGLGERFGELAPYETQAGLALGFLHLLPPAEARRAVDTRVRSVRELLDSLGAERDRSSASRGAERRIAISMLERQEALARAELDWLRTFRASLGQRRD
jgi:DNA-binding PadR family transcriptional regulator